MSISLNDFVGNLSNIVRPNRFYVIIEPPRYHDDSLVVEGISSDILKFYVQSATIPDRTFADIEVKYYGMTYKLPGNESISDLTITFINDNEWEVRNFFELWANAVNNRDNSAKGYVTDLFNKSSVMVQQLGFSGEILAAYQFYNIFPKVVSEIELNYETTDSHETFQVTFDYSYFINVPVIEGIIYGRSKRR